MDHSVSPKTIGNFERPMIIFESHLNFYLSDNYVLSNWLYLNNLSSDKRILTE